MLARAACSGPTTAAATGTGWSWGSTYRRENNAEPVIVVLSRFLSRVMDANPDINWRIITLTREPFSRALSEEIRK